MASNIGLKLKLKAVDKMSSAVNKVTKSFKPLRAGISKTNRKFKIMQGQSEKTRKSLSKFGRNMKSIGSQMTLGLTAPILGAGAAIIKTSSDFQAGMNKVQALTGATGKSLNDLRKMARNLGRETKFSATESADAMSFLAQAGFKTNEILSATPGILNLAAASNTDLARSADIASNIMGAFNLNASESGRVADVLAKTTASSNTNMEQLAEAMKDAGPVAFKFGASIEQTSALIGRLGDSGIQGSKAGTTLKNMFLKLAAPSAGTKKILTALGVNAVDPLTKKLKPMTEILKELNKGFRDKGLTDAQKLGVLDKIFGKRAIAGAGVLLEAVEKIDPLTGKASDSVSGLTENLNNAAGASKKMADIMLQGLPGAITRLKSSTEDMLLSFGFKGGFAGLAEKVIEKLIKLTNWISSFDKSTIKIIGTIAGVLAVIGPLLVGFGVFLTTLPFMISGWAALKSSLIGTKLAAISLNLSMIPLIAAVAIFATGAIMVIRQWTPIKQFFKDLFTSPLEQIKDMIGFIGELTGASKFFGFGDNTDQSLAKQGFKINGKPAQKKTALDNAILNFPDLSGKAKGPALGAKDLTAKSNAFKLQQQKAQVDINFSNKPKDTAVITEDKESILNVAGIGLMGAF